MLLRRPSARDEDAFLALVRDSSELHRGFVEPPASGEGFRAYLARLADPRYAGFLVCTHDGEIAGVANLNEIVRDALQSGYLGFYANQRLAGRGLMGEGLGLLLGHAFGEMRLHRVEANVQPTNTRSRALVLRLGFRAEGFSPRYLKVAGRWRDHDRFALLAEDWRASGRR